MANSPPPKERIKQNRLLLVAIRAIGSSSANGQCTDGSTSCPHLDWQLRLNRHQSQNMSHVGVKNCFTAQNVHLSPPMVHV